MLQDTKSSVIPARLAKTLPTAHFQSFDRRPANYYRDVIPTDEELPQSDKETPLSQERIQEALEQERARVSREWAKRMKDEYARGVAEGKAAVEKELLRTIQLFQQYAEVLRAEKAELAQRYETESVDLAFELARRVIGSELEVNPEAIRSLAREAIRQTIDSERIRVHVNPRDLLHVTCLNHEAAELGIQQAKIEFVADESIETGGCVIETDRGLLDATPDAQLRTLRSGLKEMESDHA